MDGYEALAKKLWQHLPLCVENQLKGFQEDPDYPKRWIEMAAEEIRAHTETNMDALKAQLSTGEEHEKLVEACVAYIENLTGEEPIGYLPDWFQKRADLFVSVKDAEAMLSSKLDDETVARMKQFIENELHGSESRSG